jgi:peptide/nickel transport system permease protein
MSGSSERSSFEHVDWDDIDASRPSLSPQRLVFLVGGVVLLALYLYNTYVAHVYLVGRIEVNYADWLFLFCALVVVAYGVVPLVRDRTLLEGLLEAMWSRPIYQVGAVGFAGFVLVGLLGPILLGPPRLHFVHAFHPPLGFTGQYGYTVECVGETIAGEGVEFYCRGSLLHPLGTNHRGHSMTYLIVLGARVALYIAVFAAAVIVPLATAVGVVAGLRGGLVDDLLMTYVDVQMCIPAILLYFVGYFYFNGSLLLLLGTFAVFSWAGLARLVRSEVIQHRRDGHVLVARSLGASRSYLARRHILPNITNTLVPALFHLVALLVLVEAGVAFLGFSDVSLQSWGSTIANGLSPEGRATAGQVWWISTVPAIALLVTLASLKLVGDGLRDAFDPRGGE